MTKNEFKWSNYHKKQKMTDESFNKLFQPNLNTLNEINE